MNNFTKLVYWKVFLWCGHRGFKPALVNSVYVYVYVYVTLYTYIQSISLPYGALSPRDEVPLPGRGVGVVCASSAENAWRDWRPLTATLSSNFYNLHAFIGCQIKLYHVSESESNSWHKTRIVRRDWVERSSKGRLMHFVNAKIVDTMS